MRITAKVDYAVRAAVELASQPDRGPVKGESIAEAQAIPAKFLESILGELRRAGILTSQRGAEGGYRMARPPAEVSVADIIRAVEGPLADVHGTSPENVEYRGVAKPLQQVWIATRAAIRDVLETVTLADIASGDLPSSVVAIIDDSDWTRRRV